MKLTGKCAEAYSKWFYEQDYVNKIYDSKIDIIKQPFQNALIIDFFDIVGIYIIPTHNFGWGFEIYIDIEVEPIVVNCDYSTRNEATNKAIEKAVEIFNNR